MTIPDSWPLAPIFQDAIQNSIRCIVPVFSTCGLLLNIQYLLDKNAHFKVSLASNKISNVVEVIYSNLSVQFRMIKSS